MIFGDFAHSIVSYFVHALYYKVPSRIWNAFFFVIAPLFDQCPSPTTSNPRDSYPTCGCIGCIPFFSCRYFLVHVQISVLLHALLGDTQFQWTCHLSPLSTLWGVSTMVLMLPWFFFGVRYVFNICSYSLSGCSGCISMRWIFYHIDTLALQFFGGELFSVDQFFRLSVPIFFISNLLLHGWVVSLGSLM